MAQGGTDVCCRPRWGAEAVFGRDLQLGGPESCDGSGSTRLQVQSLGLGQGLRDSRCMQSFSGRAL